MNTPMKTPIITLAACLVMNSLSIAKYREVPAVQVNTKFGLDLYAQLDAENQGKNLFFSPYSISNALAMTAEGARGTTALEMGTVLGLPEEAKRLDSENRPWNMDSFHEGLGSLNDHFNRKDKAYALRTANALWGDKSYPFNDVYLDKLSESYSTDALRPADFIGAPETERLRINRWVEDQTEKRITDLLPKKAINSDTRMVLVNAIYFKGDWASLFKASLTKEGDFTTGGGDAVKAQLMNARSMSGASYAAFNADGSVFITPTVASRDGGEYPGADGFAIAELPYKGKELSMVMISPNSANGLPAIESKLDSKNLAAWLGNLRERKLHVTMPKFKSETSYSMNKTLKAMGMPTAFTGEANFNGMRKDESNANLFISTVVHKAFVEVNEEGTEAAAATGVVMTKKSARPRTPFIPHFRADKPFIYMIRDNQTGSILFLGRMNNPEA